jgi:hypothetical protein
MWCIPTITPEFIERMEEVLDLYARAYNPHEPVLCFDEKSKQLLSDSRPMIPAQEGRFPRRDYEYVRRGTENIFLTVEPKGGFRRAKVTKRRTRSDFAKEVTRITKLPRYRKATKIHIVCDNLNTHYEKSLTETFGERANEILKRIEFHHTPKHASWLNMAEIELSILSRQALKGRIGTKKLLKERIRNYERNRNGAKALIQWKFTKDDARRIFHYNTESELS